MYWLGLDYAKGKTHATLLDGRGRIVRRGYILNRRQNAEEFLNGIGKVQAVLEAGRNWHIIVDMFEGLIEKMVLAHPLKVKAIAEAKIKTDKIDSLILAQLLRADMIPESYLRNSESRDRQKVLRCRAFYIRMRTKIRNRIHWILDGQTEQIREETATFSDLFGSKGKQWLRSVSLPPPNEKLLKDLLPLEEDLTNLIHQSDRLIQQIYKSDPDCARLESIPGIGTFLAVLIKTEIEEIERFPTSKRLCSYTGLVPSTYRSGNASWHGRITKQGNKALRWALVEAAIHAAGKKGFLRNFYFHLKRRKGTKAARVATARKIAAIVHRLLKQKQSYQPFYGNERSRLQLVNSAPI